MNTIKTIALIPARYDSQRFPGKLMKDLGGKTVIRRTFEATRSTGLFDDVYVVTDSPVIYKEIEEKGGKALYSDTRHSCGSDRIAEAAEKLDADIIMNVQGDEPFVNAGLLENLLEVFYKDKAKNIDLASPMMPLQDDESIANPNNVKVVTDADDFALYFSRSVLPYPRDRAKTPPYYKHIGIYAFRKKALLDFSRLPMLPLERAEKIECLRFLEHGRRIKMVKTTHLNVGIDTPEDLEKARRQLKS